MNAPDLILIRSDQGDGGWSLHTKQQIEEANAHDEAPGYVLSGPATWDDQADDWDRPNVEDYRTALLKVSALPD